MAKSHTSGPGRKMIPRLELEAALDSVKLSHTIKQELELLSYGRTQQLFCTLCMQIANNFLYFHAIVCTEYCHIIRCLIGDLPALKLT